MSVFNLGSINIDYLYQVPHLPTVGETLAASGYQRGLGGKGANMSVAVARAGMRCVHMGALGADGDWVLGLLTEYGVDTRFVQQAGTTGHANIYVDAEGENAIVLFPGANAEITTASVIAGLADAQPKDHFICQNETNLQVDTARMAQAKGLHVTYAAAPFDAQAVQAILPYADLLILNEVEAQQLTQATGQAPQDLPVDDVVVTLGSRGARWHDNRDGSTQEIPALKVDPVDTTGAGDTFTGYMLAGLDQGMPMPQALSLASRASALMVTRMGTADVIPDLKEVRAFDP